MRLIVSRALNLHYCASEGVALPVARVLPRLPEPDFLLQQQPTLDYEDLLIDGDHRYGIFLPNSGDLGYILADRHALDLDVLLPPRFIDDLFARFNTPRDAHTAGLSIPRLDSQVFFDLQEHLLILVASGGELIEANACSEGATGILRQERARDVDTATVGQAEQGSVIGMLFDNGLQP